MKKYLIALALFCFQIIFAQVLPNPGGGDGAGGSTPGERTTPIDSDIWILMAVAVMMMGFYAYRQVSRRVN